MTSDLSTKSGRRGWAERARERLRGDVARQAAPDCPPPEPLARLLVEVEALSASSGLAPRAAGSDDEHIDTPEAAAAFAAGRRLDVVLETRAVATLSAADCPAVMLTREGVGRLIVGRRTTPPKAS